MIYDFTSIIDRMGLDAVAVEPPLGGVEASGDNIPMWVADMNFPTCPAIPEAIIRRAEHPLYGYFETSDAYYDAIIRWHETRNGVTGLEKQHIGYENGVLGGVVSVLNVICSKGDNVLLHSPTYVGFTKSLKANGYNIVLSELQKDEQGVYRIDYEDTEAKIRDNRIHAAIFCSPHNPTGRVWAREEVERFMEICKKYDVFVISDEIWSDLILGNRRHIPVQSISEDARNRTAAMYAPSKTFNLAGLIGAYHIIYNSWLRERVDKESALSHYNSLNVLSQHALIAAYSDAGMEWTDELRQVLAGNVKYAVDFIHEHFDGVKVTMPEGTYMLFLDCTDWCAAHGKTVDELLQAGWNCGVIWQDGRPFHGSCHIRMNLASPFSRIRDAFDRLNRNVFNV